MKTIYAIFFACIISISVSAQSRSFTGKPIYEILTKRSGVYLGTTTVELYPNIAPLHVNNFDSLVSESFYDSTAFHRVIPGFMIQGGDPNSRHGDPSTWGYGDSTQPTVNAEFSVAKHLRGTLSAARDADTNSANSQFFICVAPASWLNGQYSVDGHVTAGMDIVDSIVSSPRDSVDNPLQKIEMFITYVGSNDSVPNAPAQISPVNGAMGIGVSTLVKWAAVSDAVIYHLDVATDSLFSNIVRSFDVAGITKSVTGLSSATTYYWRVNTNNGGHFSSYSPTWSFNTVGVGIEETSKADQLQVSPNPSDGIFTFSIESGRSITVYDILGNIILAKDFSSPSISIDLSMQPKGMYFYVVSAEGATEEGKLILK